MHIACHYDSGTLTMYVNGEVWGTDTGAPDLQATSSFAWGQERGSYYPDGAYEAAPFSIGPTRLSSAARYSADFTPDRAWTVDSDTIGQWLVSDGFDGTTLVDEAGGEVAFDLAYVGVNRDKDQPSELLDGLGLEYVPTFVVEVDGVEIGRVVEESPNGIEQDLLTLLRGEVTGLITAKEELLEP